MNGRRIRKARKIGSTRDPVRRTLTGKMTMAVSTLVGEKIEGIRKARGLTFNELGTGAGYTKQRAQQLMSGKGPYISGMTLGSLFRVALVLGVEPSELLPTIKEVSEKNRTIGIKMRTIEAWYIEDSQ